MTDEKFLREVVFQMIDEERERQINLDKEQRHAWATWNIIFNDYVGRVARELWYLANKDKNTADDIILSLVKVLAVGVAWLEDILNYKRLLGEGDDESEEEGN